jgi:hypothetical protein
VDEVGAERIELLAAGSRRGDDQRALLQQRAGHGQPDSLRSTRHDRDAAIQIEIHATPLVGCTYN